jgi:hypothetical protein
MLARSRFPRLLALALAVVFAASGCSTLPTQPSATENQSTFTAGSHDTSSEVLGLDGLLTSTSTSTTTTSATTTRTIGLLGGIVAAGNFTVVIPAGALPGTATVTVSQPDLAHPVVNLSISPPSANKFRLPVLLIANAGAMDRSLLSVAYMSYYNPTTGKWERIASSVNLVALTVSSPLWHFSTYRVESGGKAGW